MLELVDLLGSPAAEICLAQITAARPGLGIVAGLDLRPWAGTGVFLPSGRAALFRILVRHLLDRDAELQALLVTDSGETARFLRPLRRRVQISEVQSPATYGRAITQAADQRTALLVVDRLGEESMPLALAAASQGIWAIGQLDTVCRGTGVADLLVDWGVPAGHLDALRWVLAIQRLPTLCPSCKVPEPMTAIQREVLHSTYPGLGVPETHPWFRPQGCPACRNKGWAGEVSTFDFWLADSGDPLDQPPSMSLEANLLDLAMRGHLPLDQALDTESGQLRRTAHLLHGSERALEEAHKALERKEAELMAANRVLQQRTEALVSLEGVGQALITSDSLHALAQRLCRNARTLCGADRAVLYFQRGDAAEILAVVGWDPAVTRQSVDARELGNDLAGEPVPFDSWPPGIPRRLTDATASALRGGLRVPLVAQDRRVGLMIVHTCQKRGFSPGEVALLQTFAHQAALAIQRAGLVEELQDRLVELQRAQAQLVQKERLEREMELAREVQQSVLPCTFPALPGYAFAARNEPAREVGGDFYDVFAIEADRFGLVIGDVSDKGMPAALYMSRVHSLLRSEARRLVARNRTPLASPADVLNQVHGLLQELGGSDLFATVFFGVVDVPSRRLTFTRAGHDRPLLLRGGCVMTLEGEGTVLGYPGLDNLHLSVEEIDLAPGDLLVLYTDGLTDAQGLSGKAFGLERLKAALESCGACPPAALCEAVFGCLDGHQAGVPQYDDTTLLVVGVE